MKKISSAWKALIIGSVLVPAIVSAETGVAKVTSGFGDIGTIINSFTNSVVKSLATLFATAAMVAFFFGIVQFIWGSRDGDATRAKNGKNFMLWGLVALFVMFSVWGIITYVQQIFGVTQNTINIPTIQINSGTSNNNNNGGLPPDGTSYWRCNGQVYTTQAAYNAACPNGGGSQDTCPSGQTMGPNGCYTPSSGAAGPCDNIASETQRNACLQGQGAQNTSSCTGKSVGASCTLPSGSAGTCDTNDDGVFGCYVASCGVGQSMGPNGCYTPTGND